MVAMWAVDDGFVAAHQVEPCCLTPAQLKYMFKNTYQMDNFPISFHQQIAKTLLSEMRYDSLLNYKK